MYLTLYSDIRDFKTIMAALTDFTKLEELNLSKNPFRALPSDLSTLQYVSNLNLMDINFDDFNASVDALTTMPALKSLYISMTDED